MLKISLVHSCGERLIPLQNFLNVALRQAEFVAHFNDFGQTDCGSWPVELNIKQSILQCCHAVRKVKSGTFKTSQIQQTPFQQ